MSPLLEKETPVFAASAVPEEPRVMGLVPRRLTGLTARRATGDPAFQCLDLADYVWSATNFWKSPEMPQVTFVPLTTYTATRNRLPGNPVNVVLYLPTTGVVPAVNSAW